MTGMPEITNTSPWHELADRVLDDHALTADEGLAILRSDDEELLDLLAAAYRVRRRWFGNSGESELPDQRQERAVRRRLRLLLAIAGFEGRNPPLPPRHRRRNPRRRANRRRKTGQNLLHGHLRPLAHRRRNSTRSARSFPQVKAAYGLKICFSVGLLSLEQAQRLKAAGVDRINHNLNTSERFYPQICTTHSYQDRLATLESCARPGWRSVRAESLAWARQDADVVELALRLGQLQVEALPVNFLLPIPGTPLASISNSTGQDANSVPLLRRSSAGRDPLPSTACKQAVAHGDEEFGLEEVRRLNPRYCLKVLALFRLANPRGELRIAAGREMHLGPLQPLGLYAANSIFVDGYLTTGGQAPEEDYRMIEALGFTIAR